MLNKNQQTHLTAANQNSDGTDGHADHVAVSSEIVSTIYLCA